MVKEFSKKGFFVYLGTRDLEKGNEVVKELNKNGFQNIKAIQIDVTNSASILEAKTIVENLNLTVVFTQGNYGSFKAKQAFEILAKYILPNFKTR